MNKIAEFMNGVLLNTKTVETIHGSQHDVSISMWKIPDCVPLGDENIAKIGIFKYNRDWNWLMPVVEKIENMKQEDGSCFRFNIRTKTCSFQHSDYDNNLLLFSEFSATNKITAIYECVLAFVDYYNLISQSIININL